MKKVTFVLSLALLGFTVTAQADPSVGITEDNCFASLYFDDGSYVYVSGTPEKVKIRETPSGRVNAFCRLWDEDSAEAPAEQSRVESCLIVLPDVNQPVYGSGHVVAAANGNIRIHCNAEVTN